MRLSCPQCHTEYEVPDAALAGRARTLRCADCGTKFQAPALPAEDPALPVAEALPEMPPPAEIVPESIAIPQAVPEPEFDMTPEEIDHAMIETALPDVVAAAPVFEPEVPLSASRPIPLAPKPAQPKPNRALGVSVLLVLLIIVIVLAEHQTIGRAWPPSLRLFNALGLH